MSIIISVIVPVYKVEEFIAGTINSIINQSFKDFELIVVDDGSPDRSLSIAESLLLKSTLTYQLIHTENRGVSAARNTGLTVAKGQYVIMVDGDDMLAPDFLMVYADMIRKYEGSDVYSTSFTVYHGDGVIEQPKLETDFVAYSAKEAQMAFYNRKPRFLLPTLLLSNDFLRHNKLIFDENVRYSEDVHFIWRVLAHNKKQLIHSSYSGYKYILHPGSTMTSSGVKKILTWCIGFEKLNRDINALLPDAIRESFVPTSYFAMLHGASKMVDYFSFKEIYDKSHSETNLRMMSNVVSMKVRIVSKITTLFPYLGYRIMKKF